MKYISDEEFELTLIGISNDRFFNHTNLINRSNNYYSSCYKTIDDMDSISETVYKTEEYLQNFQYDINIIQYQVMLTSENNKLIKLPIDSSQQNPETVLTYFVSDSEDVEIEIEEGTFETVNDDQINLSSLHLNFQSVYFNDIKISQSVDFFKLFNITVETDLISTGFIGENITTVIIQKFYLVDKILDDVIFFDFTNITNMIIEEFYVKNVTFINAQLLYLKEINNLSIQNFTIIDSFIYNYNQEDLLYFITINWGSYILFLINNNICYSEYDRVGVLQAKGLEGSHKFEQIYYQQNTDFNFMKNTKYYKSENKLIEVKQSFQSIKNSYFINNVNNYGHSILDITVNQIEFYDIQFSQNECDQCLGTAIKFFESQFIIDQLILFQNIGEIGAGLYILQSDYKLNLISNSELYKNIAHSYGGAIYIDNSQLNMNDTKIYENRAEVGGGIRFKNKTPNCLLQTSRRQLNSFMQSLQIYDNTAKLFGNNFVSWIQEIKLIYEKNQVKNNTYIDKIRSGQSLEFQLQFLDDQQNIILWDNDLTQEFYSPFIINEIEKISIGIIPSYLGTDKQNIYLTGETSLVLNKVQKISNKYYINVTLYGQPTEKGYFDLFVPSLVKINYQENQLIQNYEQKLKVGVNFRDCEIGELYWKMSQNFMECKICESGTYSFEQPKIDKISEQSCKTCFFPGSNGCYRDEIYIKNGYWRETAQDLNFIKCNKIDKNNHCKAEESSSREYCEEGYIGPICKECDNYKEIWDTNYGRQIVTQKCIKCEQNYSFTNFLIYIAVIILEVWFIWFSIRNAINLGTNKTIGDYFRALKWIPVSKSSFFDITPFYCKQFFHYMAIQKYVQSISVSFTDTINIPITIFSSPIMVFYNIFDCWFSKYENFKIVYLRLIWSQMIPLVYTLLLYLVFQYAFYFKWIRKDKKFYYTGLVFMLMYLQPGIIASLLNIILCKNIGSKGHKYMVGDYHYECYDTEHILYIILLILPLLTFWLIILPLLLYRKIKKLIDTKQIGYYINSIKMGFLISDFTIKSYYWEYIKMLEKFCIIFVNTVQLRNDGSQAIIEKLSLTAVIITVYLILLKFGKPYKMLKFMVIDMVSHIILLVLLFFNILYIYNSEDQVASLEGNTINYFASFSKYFVIILDQLYFYYLIITLFSYRFKINFRRQIYKLVNYMNKKYPKIALLLNLKKPIQWKVYRNWKKLKFQTFQYIRSDEYKNSIKYSNIFQNKKIGLDTLFGTENQDDDDICLLDQFSDEDINQSQETTKKQELEYENTPKQYNKKFFKKGKQFKYLKSKNNENVTKSKKKQFNVSYELKNIQKFKKHQNIQQIDNEFKGASKVNNNKEESKILQTLREQYIKNEIKNHVPQTKIKRKTILLKTTINNKSIIEKQYRKKSCLKQKRMDSPQQYFSDYEDSNQKLNFSIKEDILNKNKSNLTYIQSTQDKELKQFPPLSNSPILNFRTLKISSSFHELKPLQLTNEPQQNINSDESQFQNIQIQNRQRTSSYSIFKPQQNCDNNNRENLKRLNFKLEDKNQNEEIQNKSKKIYRKSKYQRPIINSLSPILKSCHDQNQTENQFLQSISLNQSNDNQVQTSTNSNNSDQIEINQSKPNFRDKFGNISGIFSNQYEQTTGVPKYQKYKKKQEQQSQLNDNNNDLLIKDILKNANNDKDDENQLSDDNQIQNDSQTTENDQNKLSFPKFNQNTPKFNIKNVQNESQNISNDDLSFQNIVHNKGFQRLKKKNKKFKSQINHNLSNAINNANINDNSLNNVNQNIQDKNGFENQVIKNEEQIIADSLQSTSKDIENKNQKLLYQRENRKQKIQKTFKRILNNKNPNKTQIFQEKKNSKFNIGDDNNILGQNNDSAIEDYNISNQNQKQQNQATDSTSNQNEQNIQDKKNHSITEKSQILSENLLEFAKEENENNYKNEKL